MKNRNGNMDEIKEYINILSKAGDMQQLERIIEARHERTIKVERPKNVLESIVGKHVVDLVN